MKNCARCGQPLGNERVVADPCCGAPDCDCGDHVSHFRCLPGFEKELEDSVAVRFLAEPGDWVGHYKW